MYGTKSCDSLTRENQYLQDELDRKTREDSERQEREWREMENRRRQSQRDYQESLCYADSWTDAFGKAISKLAIEVREEEKDERDFGQEPDFKPTTYFRDELKSTRRAQELYRESMQEIEEQIKQLEQQAREKAADRLAKEFPESTVIQCLREDDFESLVNW